jgi:hypothetical protein
MATARKGPRRRRRVSPGWTLGLLLTLTAAPGAPAAGAASIGAPAPGEPAPLAGTARTGALLTTVERDGEAYVVRASGVLPVDAARLLRTSLDFERYEALGLPGLRASRVVGGRGPDTLYTWSWVTGLGRSSKHYLAVAITREPDAPGAGVVRWHLARREPGWPYEDAPAFTRLDGSWSQEPREDGTVAVHYHLVAVPATELPDRLVGWLLRRQLEAGARQLVETLARAAAWPR